jgi:hypothetical protein
MFDITISLLNSITPNYIMKFFKLFTILFLFALTSPVFAQDSLLAVFGSVRDEITKLKLENAQLIILKDKKKQEEISVISGKYSLDLPLGSKYTFIFKAKGYVQKIILIDTRNIPDQNTTGGFQLNMDIQLVSYVKGYNKKLNEVPIAKAGFDPEIDDLVFDIPYTKGRIALIEAELQRLRLKKKVH